MKHRILGRGAALVLVLALCLCSASAAIGTATVTASGLRLRSGAGTSYSILASAPAGASVSVLADAGNAWYQVAYNGLTGYMSGSYLALSLSESISDETVPGSAAPSDAVYARVSVDGSTLNLRAGPGTGYERIRALPDRAVLTVTGEENGWYAVSYLGESGYVSAEYAVLLTAEETAALATLDGLRGQITAAAQAYLGCAYVYATAGPSTFDCSGFTSYVYAMFGYSLNRSAAGQLQNGTEIAKSDLLPGDLVFFYPYGNAANGVGHVGIYLGDGNFIHASTNGYQVRIDSVVTGFYSTSYAGARRIVQ